jgi:hypothetical protein
MKGWMRELLILIGLFFALAIGMHYEEWLDHPVRHIEALSSSSLGPWHPVIIVFGVYVLLLVVRLFVKMVRKILSKEK